MNRFPGITFYLSGPFQFAKDHDWRRKLSSFLIPRLAYVLDPIVKNNDDFLICLGGHFKKLDGVKVPTFEDSVERFQELLDKGMIDEVHYKMKIIRRLDLQMVDKADVVIAYVDLETPTFGTWEEIYHALHHGKIVLWVLDCELNKLPLWLFGVIDDLELIFRNVDELIKFLDSDEVCRKVRRCICGACWKREK